MIKNHTWIIIPLVLLIFLGAFYWFQWRPSAIRQTCHNEAFAIAFEYIVQNRIADVEQRRTAQDKEYARVYGSCLNAKGLER